MGDRYERYNFNASEDDHIVSEILVNLEALIHDSNSNSTKVPQPIVTCAFNSTTNSTKIPQPIITCAFNSNTNSSYEPASRNLSEPLCWYNKRKRSALEAPPSPPHIEVKNDESLRIGGVQTGGHKEECKLDTPKTPLSVEALNHTQHSNNIHLKHKSGKRKLKDWEDYVQELEQAKQQLKLSKEDVKKFQQALLQFNKKLKDIRDEKTGKLKRNNYWVNNRGIDQLPIFVGQQHQEYSTGVTLGYYSVPYFQAKSDKNLQATEARYRRKIKINAKKRKNSISLGIRNSTSL